ncbi:MAG: M61 family metallopeptidase [Acidobacteriota bacterium]|nr:M61 family metallopeptidase [Acidobacteriota bacterium]
MSRPFRSTRVVLCVALLLVVAGAASAQAPVSYRLTFPAPEHHWMQVEATFPDAGRTPLHVYMSRTSPGRYALHEFAKNVYDVQAFDGAGQPLAAVHSQPYEWDVQSGDGTVKVSYRVYGDRVDGTYLAVDTTHAHINMPAALMWAGGLDMRPIRVEFVPPAGSHWKVATQLHPTADPFVFTAGNLQYLMDSPAEFGTFLLRTFTEGGRTFRIALHEQGTAAEADAFAADVHKIVRQEGAVYGEFPDYEPGTYTFLSDYLPWADFDGMEHRNSTVMTFRGSLGNPEQRIEILNTVAHEFFHCWNVERIRPAGLEPFSFLHLNMASSLWLAEGFTSYYQTVFMQRAGLATMADTAQAYERVVNAVTNGSGRQVRTAEQMSQMAPYIDGGQPIDRTNWSRTVISYYTWGDAIGLALDLSLRERSNGRLTLDDFMRAMWRKYGKPGGPAEGLVGHPYTIDEARETLGEVAGDPAFANEFFRRYIQGHDVPDYRTLLSAAGLIVRPIHPGRAWIGNVRLDFSGDGADVDALTPYGSPVYEAGIDEDDTILSIDGRKMTSERALASVLAAHKPGDRVPVMFVHRDGQKVSATIALAADPRLEIVPVEKTGKTLTAAEQAFRESWLGPKH